MQFLYFIPGEQIVTPALLETTGLAAIFSGSTGGTGGNNNSENIGTIFNKAVGPNGEAGILLASSKSPSVPPEKLRYDAEVQTWIPPNPDDEDSPRPYWIGFYTDNPPTPADLARDEQLDGEDVQMADGNLWHVPHARRFTFKSFERYECLLPRRWGLSPKTGHIEGNVLEKYQKLWELSGKIAEIRLEPWLGLEKPTGEEKTKLMMWEAWEITAIAIGTNYRVGFWEVMALALVSDKSLTALFDAILDFASLKKLAESLTSKKNGPDDTSAGTSGDEDLIRATPPPEPMNMQ